ncbi:D-glucuronyl C5-epimerase family protein [Pseudozobellia sp. WGM2]|uniref:D-glucuronyl C5-epimerase family protein n=1 Tax=Pseudozobellia sp. WGM2 TaxID=2787625 RepID=UPI001AE032C8|nr:D-glucuronyl C5-epimerase family protein [Pseudozobellia sp. WGM2]
MFKKTDDTIYSNLGEQYLELIDKLYEDPTYFNNGSFNYNFPHGKIKPGWWSGMGNSALVAGLTYADKVFETDNSKIIENLVVNLSTSYRKEGGLKDYSNGSSWILEYA